MAKPNELVTMVQARLKADQRYRMVCELSNVHAVQGRNDGTTPLTHQAMAETADTTTVEGTPQGDMASPKERRRGRRTMKEKEVQTYRFERKPGDPKNVLLEIGGPYGLMAKALRDAAVAINKAQYWMPSLTLIGFHPVAGYTDTYIEAKAVTTIDALDPPNDKAPHPRMEPRNGRGMRTMVPVFHERLVKPITVEIDMVVNAECPRSPEEIAGLLHAMQGVPFGPAKRGKVRILKVDRMAP